ncbi:hypothetical protein B0T19DRAFT_398435 [Cercophora scortea]|uniref:Rhodopsin domain-containing protein n=1 Tax=Cercophora scortea TaxID=314031 RepID=A0AAE0IWU6_9PEZI|nr:hypothetical protein B0T19DRAFT_398435 [Cercophora scortea]
MLFFGHPAADLAFTATLCSISAIALVVLRFISRIKCQTPWGLNPKSRFGEPDTASRNSWALGLVAWTAISGNNKTCGLSRGKSSNVASTWGGTMLESFLKIVQAVNWAKCGYAIEVTYALAVMFTKTSILASHLRIFRGRISHAVTHLVAVATAAACVIVSLASCRPFEARWNPDLFVSNRIEGVEYWRMTSIPNILTDVIILVLPWHMLWHLQVSKTEKYALTFVYLCSGIAACVPSLWALYGLQGKKASPYTPPRNRVEGDSSDTKAEQRFFLDRGPRRLTIRLHDVTCCPPDVLISMSKIKYILEDNCQTDNDKQVRD